MRRFKAALAMLLMMLAMVAPAASEDRVQWYYDLQPPSSWLNTSEKNPYISQGQLVWDEIGRSNTNGFFTNAQLVPNTGMYVTVSPINANQYASLYQIGVTDLNPFGSVGNGALPADGNQIFHQALLTGNANSVGPLVAPTTSGMSVKDLIECQVKINDTTQQTVNFVSSTNVASTGQEPRDRKDQWYCQAKLGTQATTGTETAPTVDSGWIALGTVDIPYGAASVTSGMITTNANWNGFLPAGTAATFMDLSSNQTAAGNKTFSGQTAFSNFIKFTNSTITMPNAPAIASDYQTNPGLYFNAASGSAGFLFAINGTSKAVIDNTGKYNVGSTWLGATGLNVNGTATIGGGTFDGSTLAGKSGSEVFLNAPSGHAVNVNYNNGSISGFYVWDGGTANWTHLLANGLSFSGASTSAYTSSDATVYGNLIMPNQAAGQCAQFDGSHHLVAAGGACGLASGTLTSVTSNNSNLLSNTSSGAVTLDFLHAPQFNSAFIKTPDAASGYNVYVSTVSGSETKQNSTPIAIGTNWTEPTSGIISGSAMPTLDKAGLSSGPAAPTLGSSAGGTMGATTYYVKINYVNSSGESVFMSAESSLAVAANNVLSVNSPSALSPANSVATMIFGTDQQEALSRSGNTFKFAPWIGGSGNPIVQADGGFQSGSSYYFPTYTSVAGSITGTQIISSSGSIPPTSGTQSYFATDSNGYMHLLASGNRFLFRTGPGTTFATFDAATGLTMNTSLPLNIGSSIYGATSTTVNGTLTDNLEKTPQIQLTGGISNALASIYTDGNSTLYLSSPNANGQNNPFTYQFANSNYSGLTLNNGPSISLGTVAPPAAPTLGQSAGGTLAATTYYVKVTYTTPYGVTLPSAESSLAVSANNVLTVTSPVASANASSYNVFVSTATGTETQQASGIAIGTNWTEPTTGLVAGAAMPTVSTGYGRLNIGNSYFGAIGASQQGPLYFTGTTGAGTAQNYISGFGSDILMFQTADASGTHYFRDGATYALQMTVNQAAFNGAVVGGSPTAYTPGVGDGSFSESTTGGRLYLGGSSSQGAIDYGLTNANTFTANKRWIVNNTGTGNLAAITATGDALFYRNATSGSECLGSNVTACLDFGVTNSGAFTLSGGPLYSGAHTVSGNISIPDGTAASTVLLGNTGTATSGGGFASQTLKFDDSYWTGSAAQTNYWTEFMGASNVLNLAYNGTQYYQFAPSYLSLLNTSSNTLQSNTTGANTAFVLNANNGTAPTGDLLDLQLGGINKMTVDNGGTLHIPGITFTGSVSPNMCLSTNGSQQLTGNINCVHSLAVTGPITNSGTALDPNIGCGSCLTTAGGQTISGSDIFNGNLTVNASETGNWGLKLSDATNTTSAPNKYIRANGSNGDLEFVNSAYNSVIGYMTDGGVFYGAGFVNTSRREYKKDIKSLVGLDAIDLLKQADWVQFRYKHGDQHLRYGFIADDTPSILSLGHTAYDPEAVSAVTALAVLQQQKEIETLQNSVNLLRARVAYLEQEHGHTDQRHSIFWYLFHPFAQVGN